MPGVKDGFFSVDIAPPTEADSVDARVAAAIRQMSAKLGSSDDSIDEEIDAEISLSKVRRTLDGLAAIGITVSGSRILDLGAGLGALSLEASRRGAAVVALEPGEGWREIAAERLKSEARDASVVAAGGERLPFRDGSFDGVISLQVLEHVRDPEATLREVFRVLKPGGFLWLTCENYLSFREPHYGVVWLPLLPKSIGALYLRARGRSPEFLLTSITYTTQPWVRRILTGCGFTTLVDRKVRDAIESGAHTGVKGALVRLSTGIVSPERLARLWAGAYYRSRMMTPMIGELCWKPIAAGVSEGIKGERRTPAWR